MSYSVYIQKFEKGESTIIPFDQLEQVLSKYGKIESGKFGLEFISNVGEMFDNASLNGNFEDGINGICFNRPTLNDKLPFLVFDLLGIKNTCFFGTDLEFVHSRNEMINHYPDSLIEGLSHGPKVISQVLDNWQLY